MTGDYYATEGRAPGISGVFPAGHARRDNGWRPERIGECDRCHGTELKVCEAEGDGFFDYCAPCWRALGLRLEV
jgi:hypothetical protein